MGCGCGAKASRSATRQVVKRSRAANRSVGSTPSKTSSSVSKRRIIRRPLR